MEYQVVFSASKPIIKAATFCFWRRYTGWRAWLAWVAMAGWLSFSLLDGDRSWLVGVTATLLALLPLFWIAGYVTLLRRAYSRLSQMSSKTVAFVLGEDRISTESELGKAEVPWHTVMNLWRFPSIWILHFGQASYVYLPTDYLNDSTRAFILEQAKRHGCRVA